MEGLQASSGLDRDEKALVNEAISAANEYGKAFAAIRLNRSVQNKAVEEWKNTGWAMTQNIEKATNEVITPAREAAEKAKDAGRIASIGAHWPRTGSKRRQALLLLRTTAVYYIHGKSDQEYAELPDPLGEDEERHCRLGSTGQEPPGTP